MNTEAAELLEILTRFELEGLCYAYDHIAASCKSDSQSLAQLHEDVIIGMNRKLIVFSIVI